ncbi:hypothetical protein NE237_026345 [Protea cynaroides]|uniref:Cytochrome P450 n=1 Tax=Protea cynaroides TaxID=273540 RepID=A0A9Q0H4U3_9MAGN|nr:hypothetical protein NE237_026345 [Protea cynaroides]
MGVLVTRRRIISRRKSAFKFSKSKNKWKQKISHGEVFGGRPRRLAEYFAKQRIRAPPNRFFLGNLKEMMDLIKASSYPMPTPLSHNIFPRVLSFCYDWKTIYGATSLVWFGPTVARVTVSDPKLIREVFFKSEFYEIFDSHPLMKQLEDEVFGSSYKAAASSDSSIRMTDIVEESKTFFLAGKQTLVTWIKLKMLTMIYCLTYIINCVVTKQGMEELLCWYWVVVVLSLLVLVPVMKLMYVIWWRHRRLAEYFGNQAVVAMIREAKTDVQLGDYMIPRGTEFFVPILAVPHDPALGGNDVMEFNPARFSNGVGRDDIGALIPFGLGPRTCVGQNLAMLQAKLAIVVILQRFSFRLAPTYQHASMGSGSFVWLLDALCELHGEVPSSHKASGSQTENPDPH